MKFTDPDQIILGPIFGVCALAGVIASFYLILQTAQRTLSLENFAVTCSAFSNLLGFAISPTLIATSLLVKFSVTASLSALKIGDLGFVLGVILFSVSFTRRNFKERRKELLLIYTLLLLTNILETSTIIPAVQQNTSLSSTLYLINMVTTIGFMLLNLVVCFAAIRQNTFLGFRKIDDDTLTEREQFKRQCAVMCYVLVTLAFLPKVTYDAFGWITYAESSTGVRSPEYFEMNTYLMTRALLYTSAFVQTFCGAKLS